MGESVQDDESRRSDESGGIETNESVEMVTRDNAAKARLLLSDKIKCDALREAINFAHEEQRQGVQEGRSEETMSLFQHWSATAGWLASRIRAIERGDDPDLPDSMRHYER